MDANQRTALIIKSVISQEYLVLTVSEESIIAASGYTEKAGGYNIFKSGIDQGGCCVKSCEKGYVRKRRWWIIPVFVIILPCMVFLIYAEQYYHSDKAVYSLLMSDEAVAVEKTEYGWIFDGPSEDDALIFYPGGKVEETAYAPLLHHLAGQGMDVCLVKMPFRLAVFGVNKADSVMKQHDYAHWYMGGHSLGGAMAAIYAASHSEKLSGVYMLAAYPSKPLGENTRNIIIYGSEDGVLNMEKLEKAHRYLSGDSATYVIEGGNHAQFGNYGIQDGDGDALISAQEQQRMAVEFILQNKSLSFDADGEFFSATVEGGATLLLDLDNANEDKVWSIIQETDIFASDYSTVTEDVSEFHIIALNDGKGEMVFQCVNGDGTTEEYILRLSISRHQKKFLQIDTVSFKKISE
jgi:hypothetical protein